MASYTKADLLTHIAERAGVSKADAEKVIDSLFDTVINKTKEGDKVAWPGFGSFSASKRSARTGRNPRTGEEITIPASTALKFTAAKALKDALNG
jgi:DNA-binding protein HU-beta